jgi:hypothetical protein
MLLRLKIAYNRSEKLFQGSTNFELTVKNILHEVLNADLLVLRIITVLKVEKVTKS